MFFQRSRFWQLVYSISMRCTIDDDIDNSSITIFVLVLLMKHYIKTLNAQAFMRQNTYSYTSQMGYFGPPINFDHY
jgi:hypothetical protein